MLERNRQHAPAAGENPGRAGDALDRPVAALHQHFGSAGGDERLRGVLVEPGHCAHRAERGDQRQAVGERVERPSRALAETARRGIAVQRHQQARAFGARAREVGHVPAVQDVEYAIGEHQRPRQLRQPAREPRRVADPGFEVRRRAQDLWRAGGGASRVLQTLSSGLQYSNTLTTLRTPPVVRASSTASSASGSVTMPIRYTTPASVTTLMCSGLTRFESSSRALTFEVRYESLVRPPSEEAPATCRSLVTPRTVGTARTIFSTSTRAPSSGTSPVRSAVRLKAVTLTCTRSPKRSAMRFAERTSIDSSSIWVPAVRRSSSAV